jgi:hypothetical protein
VLVAMMMMEARNTAVEAGRTELEPERMAAFEQAYDRVIRRGWRENPRQAGKRQMSKAANLLRRLDTDRCLRGPALADRGGRSLSWLATFAPYAATVVAATKLARPRRGSRPAEPTPNDHPPVASQWHRDSGRPVTAGVLGSELPLLYNTIGDRVEAIEATRLANALDRLCVGDRVRIGHDVRPGHIHGLPATMIRRGTDTITIKSIARSARSFRRQRCPRN